MPEHQCLWEFYSLSKNNFIAFENDGYFLLQYMDLIVLPEAKESERREASTASPLSGLLPRQLLKAGSVPLPRRSQPVCQENPGYRFWFQQQRSLPRWKHSFVLPP